MALDLLFNNIVNFIVCYNFSVIKICIGKLTNNGRMCLKLWYLSDTMMRNHLAGPYVKLGKSELSVTIVAK